MAVGGSDPETMIRWAATTAWGERRTSPANSASAASSVTSGPIARTASPASTTFSARARSAAMRPSYRPRHSESTATATPSGAAASRSTAPRRNTTSA